MGKKWFADNLTPTEIRSAFARACFVSHGDRNAPRERSSATWRGCELRAHIPGRPLRPFSFFPAAPKTDKPPAWHEIETQKNSISQTAGRLISVVMTDEDWKPELDVVASDRGARYDGILSFDPLWIIVIENKPSSQNIWEEQVHPNVPEGCCDIEIDRVAIVLRRRNVIERLTALVAANVLHGAERMHAFCVAFKQSGRDRYVWRDGRGVQANRERSARCLRL